MSHTDGESDADAAPDRGGRVVATRADATGRERTDAPADATAVGVARRPSNGIESGVDESAPELAPPADLVDAFDRERRGFRMRGLCEEGAREAAWDAVEFGARYRTHLRESAAARTTLDALRTRVADGEDVVVVGVGDEGGWAAARVVAAEVTPSETDGE